MSFNLIYWTPMSGSYFLYGFTLGKRLFFLAAMAGLGKYSMGGYGRIGVYRINTWAGEEPSLPGLTTGVSVHARVPFTT